MDAKQKKIMLIVGAVVILLVFVFLRSQGARSQSDVNPRAMALPQSGSSSVDFSPLAGPFQLVVDAINESQAGLAKIAENQVTEIIQDFSGLGAASWLSCLPAGGGRPDAACIKAKGSVIAPGGQNVSGVKTQRILSSEYTGPYASCRRGDGSYDLACVGYLIAGQPSFNTLAVESAVTRQPSIPPTRTI